MATNSSDDDYLSFDLTEDDLSTEVRPDSSVTWSTDWTVGTIVDQLERSRFDLEPAFQRRDVWCDVKRSRFVESLLLGIPVPQIILAERKGSRGKFIVLDGKQRLRSLQRFAGLDGPPMKLTGLEALPQIKGKTYEDLQDDPTLDSYAAALENNSIRAVVLRGWDNESLLYLTFLRLNSNVVGLSPQELRRALHPGPFMDFIMEHSGNSAPIQTFLGTKDPDFRMRDAELLIRHIALTYRIEEYRGNLRRFLDETCEIYNESWHDDSRKLIECAEGLDAAIEATIKIFGNDAFKRASTRGFERSRNRAVLDVMAFYFQYEPVRREALQKGAMVKDAFTATCRKDPDFSAALTATTKSVRSVNARIGTWGAVLANIAPSADMYIPT